ncbi:MAG: hypothetical protein ACC645_18250, partial [Pirellulales bacterium]
PQQPDANGPVNVTRANETIGYLVIEATSSGTIEGLPFVAGVGTDIVRGFDNGPAYQYSYAPMANAKTAVVSQAGMDGGDGGWAVLYGSNPLPTSSGTLDVAIDEDQIANSERAHTTEQVAYFIIDPPPVGDVPTRVLDVTEPSAPVDIRGDGSLSRHAALFGIRWLSGYQGEDASIGRLGVDGLSIEKAHDAMLEINQRSKQWLPSQLPARRLAQSPIESIDSFFATWGDDDHHGGLESVLGNDLLEPLARSLAS